MPKKVKKISKFVNQPFDFILCAVVFILLALGIVMVLSASAPSALAEDRKNLYICRQTTSFCNNWLGFNVYNIKNRLSLL